MSEPAAGQIGQAPGAAAGPSPSLTSLFGTFLMLGTTSIGGGVVAYLRATLVGKRAWLDDVAFVELLSISQTMPGLNAVNMSILVGDRLRGGWGALVATLGMCLPGALLMSAAGAAYGLQADAPPATAALHAPRTDPAAWRAAATKPRIASTVSARASWLDGVAAMDLKPGTFHDRAT